MFVTKEQARRYLVRYHHLTDDTGLTEDGIVDYVRKVGCVQYDPLDVVGRNPELVLQARCDGYRRGDVENLLYRDRSLFDVWDKNMSICAVEDWPRFSRFRERFRSARLAEFAPAVDRIAAHLREHESACSSDFDLEDRVDWHYGPQRLAKAALEFMCYAGLAVVHHKRGTRRHYCLAEHFLPPALVAAPDPNRTEEEYHRWLVLRRVNGIGLLWNRGGDAWLGLRDFKSAHREQGFAALLREEKLVEIEVEGMRHPLYLDRENLPLLEAAREKDETPDSVRILAPLDNMLWDRKLVAELFGFEYKWEVYVPAPQRKYGYYVLPVLCGDRLVGRVELRTDKQERALVVQSFWWEKGTPKNRAAVKKALCRFAKYNRSDKVICACAL